MYLQNAGEVYIDDIVLVAGSVPENGPNLLADGDFESGFPGPWVVSPNLAGSARSNSIKHGGSASLHMVATSAVEKTSSHPKGSREDKLQKPAPVEKVKLQERL